jgi:hypothetical protein
MLRVFQAFSESEIARSLALFSVRPQPARVKIPISVETDEGSDHRTARRR